MKLLLLTVVLSLALFASCTFKGIDNYQVVCLDNNDTVNVIENFDTVHHHGDTVTIVSYNDSWLITSKSEDSNIADPVFDLTKIYKRARIIQ